MELLPYLISLWDVESEIFIIKGQEMGLEEMEIYFIMRLSHRGEAIQIFGPRKGGESTRSMVHRYCPGAEIMNGGKVKSTTITNDLVLRTILFTMACVFGTQDLHEASKSQFQYAIACFFN